MITYIIGDPRALVDDLRLPFEACSTAIVPYPGLPTGTGLYFPHIITVTLIGVR